MRSYFEANDDNRRRYETVKKFRQAILEHRPKAKEWVDKPFYYQLKLGKLQLTDGDQTAVTLVIGDCKFKQPTLVVSSGVELGNYMETLANIIESEKIWNDPDMADFDFGEKVPMPMTKAGRPVKKETTSSADSDKLKSE